ncbi:TlpA disulfide reductase family protein [Roseivirga sp. BDSF3-8]|uniref:TlpA disulfide reductase family protein n=1 Tax=Roseivirga sp. BDSF3-8 TaxID=3241598 RepID=UPI003531E41C
MTFQRLLPFLSLFIITTLLTACGSESQQQEEEAAILPAEGMWRGVLKTEPETIPFQFTLTKATGSTYKVELVNGEERIETEATLTPGDSLIIPMHIFDTSLEAVLTGEGHMEGIFVKNYLDNYEIAFEAEAGVDERFVRQTDPSGMPQGKYAVTFTEENGETYEAVGVFESTGDELSGTFLTTTGDYRYLQGTMAGDKLLLSAFDGEHAFLFTGKVSGDSLTDGHFYSGRHYHATWTGAKDAEASLPEPESLTYLKEGYDQIAFTFPDLQGDMVTLEDQRFDNKVVILQLFGTWCPNCMDETKYLAEWYTENQDRGVEILGLAYEKKADFEYAKNRVKKMTQRMDVPYDFVIAGTSDKKEAAKTLPMLNHVMSFPTTIFIDRQGRVRRIHTGFSGPGTGEYFERWKEDFNRFMDKLIAEEKS